MAVEDRRKLPDGGELRRFRCVGCGYGASRRAAPERCPLCSGTVWEFERVAVRLRPADTPSVREAQR